MRVVISQSMLFPWTGMLAQVQLADVFVHYDDVQFSKGSFVNRVQIKTPKGPRWMTVPVRELALGQAIEDVKIHPMQEWTPKHFSLLEASLGNAPHYAEALELVRNVYSHAHGSIGSVARASLLALCDYFGLSKDTQFIDIKELKIGGRNSDRVLAIVRELGGDEYITGHGARHYLQHEAFEDAGVRVSYMNYECEPYPQLYGDFTPYVSSLDLAANCGKYGSEFIKSNAIPWREFLGPNQ
jgi:hypothetical protein